VELSEKEKKHIAKSISILTKNMNSHSIDLGTSDIVFDFLRLNLNTKDREVFSVLFLSPSLKLIKYREMFFGSFDAATVHPQQIARDALLCNAASIIIAHNHPSGDAEPSEQDKVVTKMVCDALNLIDVKVLDHIIIAGNEYTSFAETGLLP
jgi:DNA repair protein RadC